MLCICEVFHQSGFFGAPLDCWILLLNIHIGCSYMTFLQYASQFCASSDCQSHLLNIRIGCNDAVSPQCVSKCAFWGWQHDWLSSCTGCTCVVSPHHEWGCESLNYHFDWMTCCTEDNCTSWLHCGSADAAEVLFYLQMSLDTCHKIWEHSSLMNRTFLLPPWLITKLKMGDPEYHPSLLLSFRCKS